VSDLKKVMNALNGSAVPRQLMELLGPGVGDRSSSEYEKYAPKSRIILSVASVEPEAKPTEGDAKTTVRTQKDSFVLTIAVCLPDGASHPIGELKAEGFGTFELLVDELPANWLLSVSTKSKATYTVYGY